MKKFDIKVNNPTGLHARPAKTFVNIANQFASTVIVFYNGKKANGKSLISLLTLGAVSDARIHVEIEGQDEEHAAPILFDAISSGLGE